MPLAHPFSFKEHAVKIALLTAVLSGSTLFGQQAQFDPGEEDDEESGEEILLREEFFHTRRAGGPDGSVPQDAYAKAVVEKTTLEQSFHALRKVMAPGSWTSVNPSGMFYARTNANYIAGRTNWIAFHPTNSNIMYCAAAGGGVWKTTDGGTTWQVTTDNLSSITCGAVAVDPLNPNIVYLGTGELNYSLDSYRGDGIFKSTNAGASWAKVATTSIVSYCSGIAINPSNSSIIYIAGDKGVYRSTDGGTSWASTGSGSNANCILLDPLNPLVLYASTGGTGVNSIRKSTDGGTNWATLTSGLPGSGNGRTQLAISASNPSILYASITNRSNSGLLGLYRTTDGGSNWTLQNSSTNYLGSQGWYDNAITVSPTNSNNVVVGGLDIYVSTDGGVSFAKKTVWSTASSSVFSHADIHFLGFNGSTLYCGSDGGVYRSTNGGNAWTDLNRTISTLQFQSADYDPTNPLKLYGGTQDNNLETSTDGGVTWIQRTTGDGGYSIVDPVNTSIVYGQYVQGSLKRSLNSGVSFAEIGPNGSTGGLFYNPYEMAPGDHNVIVFGRKEVWKTTSATTATSSSGWTEIASSATVGGNVSAIGISGTNPNKIYIGTSNGSIRVTTNNGSSWSSTTGLPYVSDFVVDPANDNVCYATFTGFSSSLHVYKTTNSGSSWTNITNNLPNIPVNTMVVVATLPRTIFVGTDLGVYESTNDGATWSSFNNALPAVAVFDLKYKENAMLLMAATHGRGCFMYDLSTALPVQLVSLTARVVDRRHVRIDWSTLTETNNYGFTVEKSPALTEAFQEIPGSFVQGHGTSLQRQDYSYTDALATGGSWRYRLQQKDLDGTTHYSDPISVDVLTGVDDKQLPADFALDQNYPNPFNPATIIRYAIPAGASVHLALYNTLGQHITTLVNREQQAGRYEVVLNAGELGSGVYFYRLHAKRSQSGPAGEFFDTKKLLFLR